MNNGNRNYNNKNNNQYVRPVLAYLIKNTEGRTHRAGEAIIATSVVVP